MMKRLDTTPTLYAPAQAEALAAMLNNDDDDWWTYVVRHDPRGLGHSLIEVYDDDGALVGRM